MELIGTLGGAAVVRLPAELSTTAVARLADDFNRSVAAPDRLIVLRGADEATFCTGLALDADGPVETEAFAAVLAGLVDAPKPTLAFVDGRAIGGGLGLASGCDWVVATERATFALPELLWGLVPAMIWPLLTSRMTEGEARRWTISAHSRTASAAMAAGLVDEIAAPGRHEAALARAVRMLSRLEPTALQRMRRWSREARDQPLAAVLARGARLTAGMAESAAARARIAAFRQGDSPWG